MDTIVEVAALRHENAVLQKRLATSGVVVNSLGERITHLEERNTTLKRDRKDTLKTLQLSLRSFRTIDAELLAGNVRDAARHAKISIAHLAILAKVETELDALRG